MTTASALLTADDRGPAWVSAVLGFWFEELAPASWFRSTAEVDDAIASRFRSVYDACAVGGSHSDAADAAHALAAILVLDQFPRNIFRGTARAFATDPLALAIAKRAVGRGLDQEVPVRRRLFFYLPFEHSEEAADQVRSVALIATLGDAELDRYAREHKALIDRFGRYPYRNAILGRTSTDAERAFLATSDQSFGQTASGA